MFPFSILIKECFFSLLFYFPFSSLNLIESLCHSCLNFNDADLKMTCLKLTMPSITSSSFDCLDNQSNEESKDEEGISSELLRLVEQETKKIRPHEEPDDIINLGTEDEKMEVKVGTLICKNEYNKLIKLLHEYTDVFAWLYRDIPGLDVNIVEHKLPLKPECPLVKHKLRQMKPELSLKSIEEVKKQLGTGFIVVAKYPQWVANIVLVPKKDGKV